MKKLQGKIALITGASSGIGRGLAQAFADEGASLVISARRVDLLDRLAKELTGAGSEVITCPADVTVERDVKLLFEKAMDRFQRLDVLINNAGVFDGGPIDELSLETWEKVMAVNLRGPFLCTREAMKIMKQQRQGRIINIGSIAAQRVRPSSAPYSTSKHGLWGLTQVTALEGRDFGITCGCVHPGNTDVEILAEERRNSAEPVMKVGDWAQVVVTMASLPPDVNMLEAIVLPAGQLYIGRG
jgi:NAD(P)-dependent dehydrogenase (short-subunit alcohol dehydrogenase family)